MSSNFDAYLKLIDLSNRYFFYFNCYLFSDQKQHSDKFKEVAQEISKVVEASFSKQGKPNTANMIKDIAALQFLNATLDKQCKKFDLTKLEESLSQEFVVVVAGLKNVVNELKKYKMPDLIDSFPHLKELIDNYKFEYPC
jgi:hypothetical protein